MCRAGRIPQVLAGLVVAALVGGSDPAWCDKRVALVIGNNDYQNVPKLLKAVNDAHTMAETLKQLGFTVHIAENRNRQQFAETLLAFDNALESGDTAFFFYAGHGFEITGRNYLLPVDVPAATEGQEELVRDAAIPADRIIERLANRNVRSAILVFDACRDNPFARPGVRALAGGAGLALMQLPEGVFSVFSASPRQTALDRLSDSDSNPNSVFTRIFAKELLKPRVSLVQAVQTTRRSVAALADSAGHRQVPVYFDQMVDDVFLSGNVAGTTGGAQPQQAAAEPPKTPPSPRLEPQNVAAAPPVSVPSRPAETVNAPIARFTRHNFGWTVRLSFVDPPLAISWRFGDRGEFQETGLLVEFDPRTRRRMARSMIELAPDVQASIIEVRYVDAAGVTQGPFPIRFDPVAAVIKNDRESLETGWTDWLGFRDFYGLKLYYSSLVSYRCAISEARIGIDSMVPDKLLEMAPCDLSDPNSTPNNARIYIQLQPKTRLVSVRLRYRDGSQSEIRAFRWRKND
ncbi:MAG: caspase family protein [Alphaproteobacteria bacterium]|nr:caspase family protein [Alphaproteobacteria bacterium]